MDEDKAGEHEEGDEVALARDAYVEKFSKLDGFTKVHEVAALLAELTEIEDDEASAILSHLNDSAQLMINVDARGREDGKMEIVNYLHGQVAELGEADDEDSDAIESLESVIDLIEKTL